MFRINNKDATDDDPGPPLVKMMRSFPKSVFVEPQHRYNATWITCRKSEVLCVGSIWSKWSIWFEEFIVDGRKMSKIHLTDESDYVFADKFKLTVEVITGEPPKEEIVTFDIDNPLESYIFDLNGPEQNESFKLMVNNFCAVSRGAIELTGAIHDFDNAARSHDIVLNFSDKKLYCNKVVLALWSNYFDRLFFSETADKSMESCDIGDFKGELVMELFNCCLNYDNNRDQFETKVGSLNMKKVQAGFLLELWPLMEAAKLDTEKSMFAIVCRYVERNDAETYNNIMICLELSQKYGLDKLQEECASVFRYWLSEQERKDFLAAKTESLKKLNFKNLSKDFGFIQSSDEVDPEKNVKPENYERKIDSLTDVVLLVGDQKFKLHKDYLAFWSPYFDRLFFGGFSEAKKDEIELKEINPEEFSVLLKMIYPPRNSHVNDSNVVFLLKLADRLEIKSVMILCGTYLAQIKSDKDFPLSLMDILELADNYNLNGVANACFEKIRKLSPHTWREYRKENHARINQLSHRMLSNLVQAIDPYVEGPNDI